jgi:hypothetical protein
MSVSIEVPPRYDRLARRTAAERNHSFEENDAWDNDSRTWGVDAEDRNYIGLMGELAFSIYSGLSIDVGTHRWSDGGQDFEATIEGEEVSIDVKTTQKEPFALFVKEWRVDADYYVLGHLDGRTVTFLGGSTQEAVLDGTYSESRFGHYNYQVSVRELDPLPDKEDIL